jgi:hypothetical protein
VLPELQWEVDVRKLTRMRRAVDSCMDCAVTVDCPIQQKKAEITVARWQAGNGQYTPWTVVDCSLLPAGQTSCHVGCLPQLTDISRLTWRKRARVA